MEEPLHYCTYLDVGYLYRGLALYHSLVRYSPPFLLWILCFDDASFRILTEMKIENLRPISLSEFEKSDTELIQAKQNRSRVEYYFTCSPCLPLFLFNTNPNVNLVTYVDADLFFYSSSTPIYQQLGNNSILIIEHRFPPHLRHFEASVGTYNVGLLAFRRDEQAFKCLHWWRERCLEWCYDYCDNDRFADQKYLDAWPNLFQDVVVLRHKGANLGPWNLANYEIRAEEDRVWIDGDALICFHFQGFKQIKAWLYDPNLAGFNVRASRVVRRSIFAPYIRALLDVSQQVSPSAREYPVQTSTRYQSKQSQVRQLLHFVRAFFRREYILFMKGRVI